MLLVVFHIYILRSIHFEYMYLLGDTPLLGDTLVHRSYQGDKFIETLFFLFFCEPVDFTYRSSLGFVNWYRTWRFTALGVRGMLFVFFQAVCATAAKEVDLS